VTDDGKCAAIGNLIFHHYKITTCLDQSYRFPCRLPLAAAVS
jgi:hypothetical protein